MSNNEFNVSKLLRINTYPALKLFPVWLKRDARVAKSLYIYHLDLFEDRSE